MLIFFAHNALYLQKYLECGSPKMLFFLIIWEEHLNFAKPENLSVGATWHAPSRASVKR